MNLEALKAAKKKTGLTIAEIAQRANLPKGTVQNIFCGYVPNPRSDTLEAIERALGLDRPTWTEEDKALGVGEHPVQLSEDEWEWLELRSQLLASAGQDYMDALTKMLEEIIRKKS